MITEIYNPKERSVNPYAGIPRQDLKGTCKLSVDQIWTWEADSSANSYARLTISDATGKQLYQTAGSTHSPGQKSETAARRRGIQVDGMDRPLTMIGEHVDGHVQFYSRIPTPRAVVNSLEGTGGNCTIKDANWNEKRRQGCPNTMAEVGSGVLF